jgi:cytochrome c biogenesis protein CcdA
MIVIFSTLFGALLGAQRARRHGGGKLDMAQWAAGFAIPFALIGLFVTIMIERAF